MQCELGRRFVNRTVLITGVNERGFGGAIAERLAREGATVALLDLQLPTRLARRLERMEVRYLFRECDVTDRGQIEEVVEETVDQFGPLHGVVNNAGVGEIGPIEQLTEEQCQRAFDVNVTGIMRLIQCALPHLAECSSVVNIASALGQAGCKWYSLYSATKASVIGMTRSLALELADRGIRVNCVAPALAHTPMVHAMGEYLTPEAWHQLHAAHPLGLGSPHDVAAAVAFLASEEASWITGVTLPMGWTEAFPLPVDALDQPKQRYGIFPERQATSNDS